MWIIVILCRCYLHAMVVSCNVGYVWAFFYVADTHFQLFCSCIFLWIFCELLCFLYDNKRESAGFIRNAEISIIINPCTAYLGHWQYIFNQFWQTIPHCPQWPHTCVGTAGDKILFAKFDWTWSEILLKPLFSSNVFQYLHVDIYLPVSKAWPEMCHFINACVNL